MSDIQEQQRGGPEHAPCALILLLFMFGSLITAAIPLRQSADGGLRRRFAGL